MNKQEIKCSLCKRMITKNEIKDLNVYGLSIIFFDPAKCEKHYQYHRHDICQDCTDKICEYVDTLEQESI